MNILTPDKVEKLWHAFTHEVVEQWDQETLKEFALAHLRESYISEVYKHKGYTPDPKLLIKDVLKVHGGDEDDAEKYLNRFDITLETIGSLLS